MEQRVIDAVAKDLWKDELKFRKDPKNANVVRLEKEFFKELNELGYEFSWSMQFSSNTFTEKDKAIIPIFIKYLDMFDDDLKSHFIFCLGVNGFYDATEYVLNEYERSLLPSGDVGLQCAAAQTLERIQDPRYIDKYIYFLNENATVFSTWYFASLLGKMRVKKAIPHLIKLLDGENKIKESYYGTGLEDEKYAVSQESIKALAQFKDPEHIKYVEKFLEPENLSWIQYPDTKDGRYLLKKTYREYKKIAEKAIKKMGGNPIT